MNIITAINHRFIKTNRIHNRGINIFNNDNRNFINEINGMTFACFYDDVSIDFEQT